MTYKDIIALANAGYTAGQIGQLAQLEQMPAPATPAPATPAPDYNAIMAELLGIKQAVQVGNIQQTQQPPVLTPDDILANIIAPKPRGKDD